MKNNKERNSKAPLFIIAIRGTAGSGKDYISDAIIKEFPYRSVKLKNASFMKDMLNNAISQVFLGRKKRMSEEEFENLKNDNEIFPTDPELNLREILQYLGTEIIRGISEHFHVKQLAARILKNDKKIVLVPDVRFPNEEKFIAEYNSIPTQSGKKEYLEKISTFTPEQFSSLKDSLEKMKEIFGDNDFTNYMYSYLIDSIDVEDNSERIEAINEVESGLNEHIEYPDNFDDALKDGLLFILRKSNRNLDTSHSSELYNGNMAKEANDRENPGELVFYNEIDVLKNPQFVDIIKRIILELIRKRPSEKEYIYSDELEKEVENTDSLAELRILMDGVRSIDAKTAKSIRESILKKIPKSDGKKTKTGGNR